MKLFIWVSLQNSNVVVILIPQSTIRPMFPCSHFKLIIYPTADSSDSSPNSWIAWPCAPNAPGSETD